MSRRWLIVPFILCLHQARAARLPPTTPTAPPSCEVLLEDGKVQIGDAPKRYETVAKEAAAKVFWNTEDDAVRSPDEEVVRAVLELADGSAVVLVDFKEWSGGGKITTFAVRVSPSAETEVFPFAPTPLPKANDVVGWMTVDKALEAAREDYPVGSSFPGTWAGGGAPQIKRHAAEVIIPMGPNETVVLVALVGEMVSLRDPTMYVVAEVRGLSLYSLTDPSLRRVVSREREFEDPRIDTVRAEHAATKAARDHLIATHVPRVHPTTIQMKITRSIPTDASLIVGVEISFVTAGFSGLRESARYLVTVPQEGESVVERERAVNTARPGGADAVAAVRKYLAEHESGLNVLNVSTASDPGARGEFVVNVKVDKGSIGSRLILYRVTFDANGNPSVSAAAAQG